jgi:hypothetical protein
MNIKGKWLRAWDLIGRRLNILLAVENSYACFENDDEKSSIEVEKHARLRGGFTVDVDVAVSP